MCIPEAPVVAECVMRWSGALSGLVARAVGGECLCARCVSARRAAGGVSAGSVGAVLPVESFVFEWKRDCVGLLLACAEDYNSARAGGGSASVCVCVGGPACAG